MRDTELRAQRPHHPHRGGLLLDRVATRRRLTVRQFLRHNPILVSKVRSLQQTQGASDRRKSPGESRFLSWASSCPAVVFRGPLLVPPPAFDADGGVREGGDVAELTGLIDPKVLAKWPAGMRVIVRRERPHPGAQLSLFEERDGWRYEAFVTNTTAGQLAFLEARHRAHARVEDRIRHAKDSGLGRFPSREFNINQTWLMITQIAADLTAWTRLLGCIGSAATLATCEPKALRYRFLHVPTRLAHSARRRRLKIPESWPWAAAIVAVFANIAAIPQPA
ncbi:transposase [Kocuria sp. cx-116]|uniref:transposase n=1 Tax=Kocuria sp. cx-116 TaxID=2771378 RepID=UPI0027D28923|nr:transposase [Kocuria sp. cx-116]